MLGRVRWVFTNRLRGSSNIVFTSIYMFSKQCWHSLNHLSFTTVCSSAHFLNIKMCLFNRQSLNYCKTQHFSLITASVQKFRRKDTVLFISCLDEFFDTQHTEVNSSAFILNNRIIRSISSVTLPYPQPLTINSVHNLFDTLTGLPPSAPKKRQSQSLPRK